MKITAEFDTVSKELIVKKDGATMENVQYVSFRPDMDDEMGVWIQMFVKDKVNDVCESYCLEASKRKHQ